MAVRKKLSLLLIAIGLLLGGAGGWEAYSTARTSEAHLADDSSRESQADLAQGNSDRKESQESSSEGSESKASAEKEKQKKEAISSGESKSDSGKVEADPSTSNDGRDTQKTSSGSSGSAKGAKGRAPQSTSTISITGDRGARILPATRVEIRKGDTVYDVLLRVTRQQGIQMEARGSGKTLYVEGINNLYEFDGGPESGWMYQVNGVFPNYSAGVYDLRHGDRIEWRYTRDLGRDIGASF